MPDPEHKLRTRLSICARKQRYASAEQAATAARKAQIDLRHYRCDRCFKFHLTSRTKGKRMPGARMSGSFQDVPSAP